MKRLPFALALLWLGIQWPATAWAAAQRSPTLTLEQAVNEGLESNHDVARAQERLALLDGQIMEVKSLVYPQLSVEGAYRRNYDESILDSLEGFIAPEVNNNYSVKTKVDQLVFSWGKVSTAVKIAVDSRRQAKYDLATTERDVILQIHEAFYFLLLAEKLVAVAEETLANRERQLDVARKRFEAGVVNELEVIRARVDVANAKTPLIRARNQVLQAKARLNNLLARDQASRIEAVGQLEYVPLKGLTLDTVVDRALTQRPELASLRVGREIAEKNLRIAHAEDKPEVNFQAEYGYATQDFDDLNANRERWGAGVVLRLPLFDGWRTRGLVAQASSQMREVRIATQQLRDVITLQAKVTLDALSEGEELLGAQTLTVDQARESLELAETSYRYGVATALDVTDAQLGLTRALTDNARALHDYMVARARVLSVMNEL